MKNPILPKNNSFASLNNLVDNEQLQNMILRYVYEETSANENTHLEKLLASNKKLNQFFYEVISLKKQMDDCQTKHKPSSQVIDKILNYSKK